MTERLRSMARLKLADYRSSPASAAIVVQFAANDYRTAFERFKRFLLPSNTYVLFLDVPPEFCHERMNQKNESNLSNGNVDLRDDAVRHSGDNYMTRAFRRTFLGGLPEGHVIVYRNLGTLEDLYTQGLILAYNASEGKICYVNDLPILWRMYGEEVRQVEKGGQFERFVPLKEPGNGFGIKDLSAYDDALMVLDKRISDINEAVPGFIMVEFTRPYYVQALKKFSPKMLKNFKFLLLQADQAISRERNRERGRRGGHVVPEDVMDRDFGEEFYKKYKKLPAELEVQFGIPKADIIEIENGPNTTLKQFETKAREFLSSACDCKSPQKNPGSNRVSIKSYDVRHKKSHGKRKERKHRRRR